MRRRKFIKLFSVLVLFLTPSTLYAGSVVQVSGKDLPTLLGEEVANIGVYASDSSGKIVPIPFQIDEKVSVGEKSGRRAWAWDSGSQVEDKSPQKNGKLEEDEVLLFLSRDGGDALEPSQFADAKKVYELLINSEEAKKVYLVLHDKAPSYSTRRYIQFDPEQDKVTTENYEVAFSKAKPFIQNKLILKNGSLAYNILDRFKLRLKMAIKNFFDLEIDEEDIKSKISGYRVGPIRIIRNGVAWKKLGPIKVIPKSNVFFFFYPDWIEIPIQINNPFDGPKFLEEKTKGVSGLDFNRSILGSDFYTNSANLSFKLDGKPESQLNRVIGSQFRWWSFSGLAGSMVFGITNDRKLSKMGIHPLMILVDDMERSNPPESQKGEVFIGFDLPYYKIPKGNYWIQSKEVFPKAFQHGMEEVYLRSATTTKPVSISQLK